MGVEFKEGDNSFKRPDFETSNSSFVQFLISKGLAKDSAGANKILIIVAIVAFVLSLFFFF